MIKAQQLEATVLAHIKRRIQPEEDAYKLLSILPQNVVCFYDSV